MKKNKNTSSILRQGDVLLIPINSLPKDLKQTKTVTLALGEVTGHHHTIYDNHCAGFSQSGTGLADYLEVIESEAALTHQEHDTIAVPPGKYKVHRQVEYTPETLRNVAD